MSARNFDLFGTKKRFGNVTIMRNDRFITVLLHGNEIVTLDTLKGLVRLSNCGWCTPTTHSAINTALRQIPNFDVSVHSVKGETMLRIKNQSRPLDNGEYLRYKAAQPIELSHVA